MLIIQHNDERNELLMTNQDYDQSLVPAISYPESECFDEEDTHSMLSKDVDQDFKLISKQSAIFTMCISIVGAGCLSLPYALRNVGLIIGICLLFLAAIMSYFTLDLLLIAVEYLPSNMKGTKPNRNISYLTLAQHSYGHTLHKTVQILLTCQYFGASVAYIVTFCGTIDLVWSLFFDSSIYTKSVLIVCYLIIFPISLLRDLSSLKFTSLLGFSGSIYLCIVVIVEYFVLCDPAESITSLPQKHFDLTSKELFPETFGDFCTGFLTAFPLIIFAFTGHAYVLPLYDKLRNPSITKMRGIFKTALFTINWIYLFIATFGFLMFLNSVCGNLLLNDFKRHFDVILAALGISVSCILTEPIFIWNFRRMIGVLCLNQTPKEMSKVWHVSITFVFLSVNVVLAIFVRSISVVFGFLGCTMYPAIGYLLPAIFFCKLAPSQYKIRKVAAVVLAIMICSVSLCSLGYKMYSPGDLDCDNAQSIG